MPRYQLGILTEGAITDNGVLGIIVYIENGSKIHLDAHAAALASHLAPIFIEQHVVVQSAQDEVTLEVGHFLEAHSQTPLAVDGNHQRHRCQRLGEVGNLGLVGHGAVLVDESAHHVLCDKTAHQSLGGIII